MRLRLGTDCAISVPTVQQCRVRPNQDDKKRLKHHEDCVLDRSGDKPGSCSDDGISGIAVELYLRRRSTSSCQCSNASTAELQLRYTTIGDSVDCNRGDAPQKQRTKGRGVRRDGITAASAAAAGA